jgi:PKD repeat protein
LNPDGSEILTVSGFYSPGQGISVDQTDGSVWVADQFNNEVVKLDTNGNELVRVNVGSLPYFVVANPVDGGVWVAFDYATEGPIKRLDSSGNVIAMSEILFTGGWVRGLDIAPDGTVWVSEMFAHKIHKVSPTGELLLTVGGDSATFYRPGWISIFPNNPPVAEAGGPYSGDEGSLIPFDARDSSDPDGDPLTFEWDLDNDGEYDDAIGATPSHSWPDDGTYTIGLRVTDGSMGESDTATAEVTVDNVAPTITSLTGVPSEPIPVNTPFSVTAEFSDPGVEDTHDALWNWGDGTTPQNDVRSPVTTSYSYTTPGVYTISVTITDDDGDSDTFAFTEYYVVVYDSSGGFVTGGGWIYSLPGALSWDTNAEGKANFGFVSKYKKGAETPTGQTEFRFQAGDLDFHSTSYDWLVIAGAKAKYKGTGTINGEAAGEDGEYKFLLSTIDGDLNGDGAEDKFRIRIWEEDEAGDEHVVYDNQVSDDDLADPTTVIGGGNIKIHKG